MAEDEAETTARGQKKAEPINDNAAKLAAKLTDPDSRDLCGEELGPMLVNAFDALQHILDIPDDDIKEVLKEWVFDPLEPVSYQSTIDLLEDIHNNADQNFEESLEKFAKWFDVAKQGGITNILVSSSGLPIPHDTVLVAHAPSLCCRALLAY